MEQIIFVYVDLMGVPMKVGQIWGHFHRKRYTWPYFSFCSPDLNEASKASEMQVWVSAKIKNQGLVPLF